MLLNVTHTLNEIYTVAQNTAQGILWTTKLNHCAITPTDGTN